MSGLIVVNKPSGYTSRDVVSIIGKELKQKKVGHTGTLDPMATGVLVVCLGKYTKLTELLTSLDKEYIAEIKLGIETDTLDITGTVLEERNVRTTKEDILRVFASFLGEYQMEVPKYSALKVNGKKLYEYARNGEEVKLPIKKVYVYELELLSFTGDIITFRAKVLKGTYIRSLIRDITHKLGIIGTMNNLVRIRQGNFKLEDAYSIEDIKNNKYQILKIKDVLNIPIYCLNALEMKLVRHGNKISINSNDKLILCTYQNEEVAIYEKKDDLYKPKVMLI